jgi:hypothetical protein
MQYFVEDLELGQERIAVVMAFWVASGNSIPNGGLFKQFTLTG